MVSTAPWSGDTIMAPSAVLSKPPRGVTSSPTATGCSSMWRSRMGTAGGWTTAISASRRPSPRPVAWHGARDARERRDAARKLLTRGERPAERVKLDRIAATVAASNNFKAVAYEWLDHAERGHSGWTDLNRVGGEARHSPQDDRGREYPPPCASFKPFRACLRSLRRDRMSRASLYDRRRYGGDRVMLE